MFRFSIRDNVSRFCALSEEGNRRRAILLRQDYVDNRFVTDWLVQGANLVRTAARYLARGPRPPLDTIVHWSWTHLFGGILRAQGPFESEGARSRAGSCPASFYSLETKYPPKPETFVVLFALISSRDLKPNRKFMVGLRTQNFMTTGVK